jgi:hypothetical protein
MRYCADSLSLWGYMAFQSFHKRTAPGTRQHCRKGGAGMKTLIPFTVACFVLICVLITTYFISPNYQIQALQAENYHLKSELAQQKADNQSELVAVVVIGMLSLTALLMTGFFLMLCLLSGTRPADFLRIHRTVRPVISYARQERLPQAEPEPEPEPVYYIRDDDRYMVS